MNKLSRETRSLILKMLCEGQSMRSTARLVDNTVAKLLVDASRACSRPGDSNRKLQHLRADPLDPLYRLQGGRPMTGQATICGPAPAWMFTGGTRKIPPALEPQ